MAYRLNGTLSASVFRSLPLLLFILVVIVGSLWFLRFYVIDALAPVLPKPVYVTHKCWFENTTTKSTECGYLYVSERRLEASSRTLRLPVVIFRSDKGSTGDPVVYLPGGPGSAFVHPQVTGPLWEDRISGLAWLYSRDLIAFDYRGTGLARPSLRCDQFARIGIGTERRQKLAEAVNRCLQQARLANTAFPAYDTATIAADVDDLRKALGIKSWNLWGESYGSRVALEVMRRYPDGVRAAMLQAVLPPEIGDWSDFAAANFDKVLNDIFALCEEDSSCNSAHPNLPEKFRQAVERLRRDPVYLKLTADWPRRRFYQAKLDDALFLDVLGYELYWREGVQRIPRYIALVNEGQFSRFKPLLEDYLAFRIGPFIDPIQYYTVHCNDLGAMDEQLWQSEKSKYELLRNWMEGIDVCKYLPLNEQPTLDRSAVQSAIPTLLLAGAFDWITPPGWAQSAGKSLENGYVFVLPSHSHDVGNSYCAKRLVSAFLTNPKKPPEDACLEQASPPPFVLP